MKGTAVFLSGSPGNAPSALMHNLKHNKVLHEQNVIVHVVTEDTPRVDEASRATTERLSEHFLRVTLRFGFMEVPNVPKALSSCRPQGLSFDVMRTSFFLSRRSIRPSAHSGMPLWQDKLFISLARSASDVTEHFRIPPSRAVEVVRIPTRAQIHKRLFGLATSYRARNTIERMLCRSKDFGQLATRYDRPRNKFPRCNLSLSGLSACPKCLHLTCLARERRRWQGTKTSLLMNDN